MVTDARSRLDDIVERLDTRLARSRVLAELNELFRSGSPLDPAPDGFLTGRVLATSTFAPLDTFGLRARDIYMPWRGKSFSAGAGTGVNILPRSARMLIRLAWPSYDVEGETPVGIEAFPFRTWMGPGAVDPDVDVLKIDYDSDGNPRFIRRVLDELVAIGDGLYLGKVLLRSEGPYRCLGFFSLQH